MNLHKIRAFDGVKEQQQSWPCVEKAEIIESGKAIGVLLREFDGSISAIRIAVEQLAD